MKLDGKIRTLLIFFSFVLAAIFLRASYWQVVQGENLSIEADQQHFFSLDIPAARGLIKTADGFSLVANKQSYVLYANLHELNGNLKDNAKNFTSILVADNPLLATNSAELDIFESEMEKKLTLPDVSWVRLASGISEKAKENILNLNITGLGFYEQPIRDYPEGSMAGQLLGFISEGRKGIEGNFGLEGYYEEELKGRAGKLLEEKDAFQRPILIGDVTKQDNVNGSDLILSLDRGVQRIVEKYLAEGIVTWQASGGTAIVMDPNSGDIIAAASFPRYDPKNYFLYSPSLYKDPMVSLLYEPGSIMKPLVMSAAINEGKLTPETRCPVCAGPRAVGGYVVHTFDNQYHPNLTMTEVLINSDNTGMIYVGETLGFEKLYEYLKRFGFSQKTGVDLQGEQSEVLRPLNQWYAIDQATATFGQGIAVNSLQMVRGMAVIANGGKLVTPRVVKAVIDSNGQTKNVKPKPTIQVISPQTAKIVTEMLVRVTAESELHFPRDRMPSIKKYRIAAKSGTAQIPIAGHYDEGRTTGSVLGFGPADSPKFVVLVKLDSPLVRPWGSDTAGPIFFSIMQELFNYFNISP